MAEKVYNSLIIPIDDMLIISVFNKLLNAEVTGVNLFVKRM